MTTPPIKTGTCDAKTSNINYWFIGDRQGRYLRSALLGFGAIALSALSASSCGSFADDKLCGSAGCDFSNDEWTRLSQLAGLPEAPPADPSNRFAEDPAAQALGHKWFYDGRFSGPATLVDQLKRPVPYARAEKGKAMGISCVTCHDPARGSIDDTSVPGHISVGAGWFDVNAQPTFNSAFYQLSFWNGRADSLWAQAVLATEGGVAMNNNRLRVAWLIGDLYRADYQSVFADYPLPMTGPSSAIQPLLDSDPTRAGRCALVDGACPTNSNCREATDAMGATSCWPRFPLNGKPGNKTGCQAGDATEPFGDAWDCMAKEDQAAITRVIVNFGKGLAAYESRLVSRNSAFDRFVAGGGPTGTQAGALSPSAIRGARLFVGRAACSDCHSTPLMSDNQFHNVGVAQTGAGVPTEAECPAGGVCDCVEIPAATAADGSEIPKKDAKNCLPWGGRDGIMKLQKNGFRRDSMWSDDMTDTSRMSFVDMDPAQVPKGAWRTPTLRDIALTAPYMHDGSMATLEAVIDHYNRGGSDSGGVGVPAAQIRPLYLSSEERSDLIEFLKALTGEAISAELRSVPALP